MSFVADINLPEFYMNAAKGMALSIFPPKSIFLKIIKKQKLKLKEHAPTKPVIN